MADVRSLVARHGRRSRPGPAPAPVPLPPGSRSRPGPAPARVPLARRKARGQPAARTVPWSNRTATRVVSSQQVFASGMLSSASAAVAVIVGAVLAYPRSTIVCVVTVALAVLSVASACGAQPDRLEDVRDRRDTPGRGSAGHGSTRRAHRGAGIRRGPLRCRRWITAAGFRRKTTGRRARTCPPAGAITRHSHRRPCLRETTWRSPSNERDLREERREPLIRAATARRVTAPRVSSWGWHARMRSGRRTSTTRSGTTPAQRHPPRRRLTHATPRAANAVHTRCWTVSPPPDNHSW
jgi:hypothetical protein